MRNRSSVVIIDNGKIALIKRVRNNSVYYVFPGGGIENGETPKETAKREALEELGVIIQVNECIAEIAFNGMQYYFLAEITGGTFGTGQGEEFTDVNRNRGTYLPVWIAISMLSSINIKPKEVALKVQTLYQNRC